jgi:hypothetical protein
MAKYEVKYEDLVAEEDKRAYKDKARNAQIKADAEAMRKKYPEKSEKAEKSTKKQVGTFIVDDSEPTEKEREMMRQQVRERKMDEGTARGAAQYEGFKKGGLVTTKGQGCCVRGKKPCKVC